MKKLLCALALGLSVSSAIAYDSWETELTAFQKASQDLKFLDKSGELTPFATKMFDELAKTVQSDGIDTFRKAVDEATADGTSLFQLQLIQARLSDLIDQSKGIPSINKYPIEQALRENKLPPQTDGDYPTSPRLGVNIEVEPIQVFTDTRGHRAFPVVTAASIPLTTQAESWYQKTPIVAAPISTQDDSICDWAPKPSSVDASNMNWEDLLMSFAPKSHTGQPEAYGDIRFTAFKALYDSIKAQTDATHIASDLWALAYLVKETQLRPQPVYPEHQFRNYISYGSWSLPPHMNQSVLNHTIRLDLQQFELGLKALSTPFFALDGSFEAEFKRWKYKEGEFSETLLVTSLHDSVPELSESTEPLLSVVDWINQTGQDKAKPILNDSVQQFIHPRAYYLVGFSTYNALLELNAQLSTIGKGVQLWDGNTFNGKDLYLTVDGLLSGFFDRHKSALAS